MMVSHSLKLLDSLSHLFNSSFVQIVFSTLRFDLLKGCLDFWKHISGQKCPVVLQDLLEEEFMTFLGLFISLQRKVVEELGDLDWVFGVKQ